MGSSRGPRALGTVGQQRSKHACGRLRSTPCPPSPGRRPAAVALGMLSVPVLRACPNGAPEASRTRRTEKEKTT
jgi:hypothetical protein